MEMGTGFGLRQIMSLVPILDQPLIILITFGNFASLCHKFLLHKIAMQYSLANVS